MVAIRMRWSGASLLMDHRISHLKGCSLAGSNFSGVCGQQLTQHVVEEEELGHAFILQDSQFLALYVVIRSYSSGSLRSSVL